MTRPGPNLTPKEHPEWLQMELAERAAKDRRNRRLEFAKVALWLIGITVGLRAGWLLWWAL